jgi:hypothetical protein
LNLSAIHFPCAYDLTFEGLWLIQTAFVPLLYPVLVVISIGLDGLYSIACKAKVPGTSCLMACGMLPRHGYSRSALFERYFGPGRAGLSASNPLAPVPLDSMVLNAI